MSAVRVGLFYSDLFAGGLQRAILNLADGFTIDGLNVDLVLVKAHGDFVSQIPSTVRVVDLRARRKPWHSLLALISYLRRERPDVLLSFRLNPVAILAKRLARVTTKVVMIVQTHISSHAKCFHHPSYRVLPLLARSFYPLADGIAAISEGVADDISRITKLRRDRIRVIHNPVFTPHIIVKAGESLEHPWFAPGSLPVVLGVGRFNRQKDFPTLIRAFAIVRARRLCRLMVLGNGAERRNLENLVSKLGIEKDAALPGFVMNPYPYMARSSLFVLSSLFEGLAHVLIEAMACGTPVISTDCPSGPAEILEQGRYGKLVPVGDVEALAEAILTSLDVPMDPGLLQQRASEFSLERAVTKYRELISSL